MSREATSEAALSRFVQELTLWGERMNLVGSTDPAAIARHVDDALAAVPYLEQGLAVVDLGSGAGFPGLPIAISRRDLRVSLVEIREKRVAFLRHVARDLALEVDILRRSIEAPAPRRFDRVLLRAVAHPERSAEIGREWVSEGGEVWIWAGPGVELPDARSIPLASGGAILRIPAAAVSRGTD